ncbi:MAG: lipopolysaccharide core heptose(II) kinase RfaY [Coriobacteriales bacterium]|nr:lipopolysaccharide core heptose(II) kinase RfaY [Coriobacteriales bacterium]
MCADNPNQYEVAGDGIIDDAERLRSWYETPTDVPPMREETIGLLGTRKRDDMGRRSKYKRVMHMLSIVRKYDILHGLTPITLRRMLEELGPTFVKAGQILSMRSEILPESFCRELAKLRTEVEPMSHELVLDTLRQEYDTPIEQIFESIDDIPLGSASVAQVHKARLVTGELVAIKVQRPNVRKVMAQDIGIMRSLARRAKRVMGTDQVLDIQSVVEELWQSFREETDFLVEARSLWEFSRNNADCVYVGCPKPYPGLCTEHVVVMEYVEGIPISHLTELTDAGYDLDEIGTKLVDNYTSQMLDDGFFHADPHPGNIVISGGKIVYLDLGMMGRLSSHDRKALSDMVFAVADLDTPRLKDGLLRFAAASDVANIDHARLLADLDVVVQEYGTARLADLDLSRFLNSLITLARRSGVEMPGSVTMLARSLVTLEGTVDELLASKSIVDIIAAHVGSNTSLWEEGKNEAGAYAREVRMATHGLLRAASQASLAMNMLTRGQLRVNMDVGGSDDPLADFSHAFDRLTMGIVIAGLFIGSSVIYFSGVKPLLFGIPVVGFVGFMVAMVLGIRLVADIMHEGKKRR